MQVLLQQLWLYLLANWLYIIIYVVLNLSESFKATYYYSPKIMLALVAYLPHDQPLLQLVVYLEVTYSTIQKFDKHQKQFQQLSIASYMYY